MSGKGRLNQDHAHVWDKDPALDYGQGETDHEVKAAKAAACAEAVKKFNDEEAGRDALPVRNGRAPVVWRLRCPSGRLYADLWTDFPVRAGQPVRENLRALMMWLRVCVVGAEGAKTLAGRPIEFTRTAIPGGEALTEPVVNALFEAYGPNLITNLGFAGMAVCELDPL